MTIQKIDDYFAVSPQIQTGDVKRLAEAGFKGIVCARPDNEEPGQASFSDIAQIAERVGLKAFHIPVSGPLTKRHLVQFEQVRAHVRGPILGYCRSGGRAGRLYKASL
jgi:uncharacterized protein (TIGR01244 family)